MSFLLNPFVFAGAAGDFESIATVTVGSGGASSIEFTSIPGTYQHLQVRMLCRTDRVAAWDYIAITLNSDTGANYAYHELRGDGSSVIATAGTSSTFGVIKQASSANLTAGIFGGIVTDILDYSDASKNSTVRSFGGADGNGSGQSVIMSSLWMDTSTVSSIKLQPTNGANDFVEYSTAALYGIKA